MVRASLTLTVPSRTWIGTVSRRFPEARFQVRSAQSCDGVGIGFVEIVASDPAEMPFEIADGEVTWNLTTTRTRLSTLADELERSDLGYMVEHVWDSVQFDRILTERQQEVVEEALERGYYESPRTCTQEELADALGMAKSTCSEVLHRAEERIVKRYTDGDQPAFTQIRQQG